MSDTFPHINIKSDFSFFQSGGSPESFVKTAKNAECLGLADINSLSSTPYFAAAALQAGIRPSAGIVLSVSVGSFMLPIRFHAKGNEGWSSLCRLQAAALVDQCLELSFCRQFSATTITILQDPAYSGGNRALPRELGEVERIISGFFDAFPFGYLEDLRWASFTENSTSFAQIARAHQNRTIAAAPVCYPTMADRDVWRVMAGISAEIVSFDEAYAPEQPGCHLLSESEMATLFEDAPEAIQNARMVAKQTSSMPQITKVKLPQLPGGASVAADLRTQAKKGLSNILGNHCPGIYAERLEFELDAITRMGFADYFLIVADFVRFAKDKGIPVGPGRGSGAGSLVAWALGITEIDPLRHGLLFERFINPNRVSLPDFDIDFCERRRDEVLEYVRQTYGVGHVARLATFSEIRGNSAIKDTARILGMHFSDAAEISARFLPAYKTLKEAMASTAFGHYIERDPIRKRVITLAQKIEGLRRHAGVHAAGLIIAPDILADEVPLWKDPGSQQVVCGFDMSAAEKSGLVKFDFLGLSTLTIIKKANEMVGKHCLPVIPETACIKLDDADVYKMLAAGHAVGVFQFDGMSQALKTVKPTRFEDLVALNALYRPGPIGYIRTYAERKLRFEELGLHDYPLPEPRELTFDILRETFGIMVYQEQIMKIAQVCAGYTLGEADLLRRAISKKNNSELVAHKQGFIQRCVSKQNISPADAAKLYDDIEKFANYGFNKSHAVAYALLGYKTAFFKVKYPAIWFASLLCFERDLDRRAVLASEARRMGVIILPPCINRSDIDMSVEPDGDRWSIRFGLGHIAGIGEATKSLLFSVVKERQKNGAFSSLIDLSRRIERGLPKQVIKSLASAGALDALSKKRAGTTELIEVYVKLCSFTDARSDPLVGDDLFFGPLSSKTNSQVTDDAWVTETLKSIPPKKRESLEKQLFGALCEQEWDDRIAREVSALGFSISKDPLSLLAAHINATGISDYDGPVEQIVGTPSDYVAYFKQLLAENLRKKDGLPTLRGKSCIVPTAVKLVSDNVEPGNKNGPSLVLDYIDQGRNSSVRMSRAYKVMQDAKDLTELCIARGRPIIVEIEVAGGQRADGAPIVETRIVGIRSLADFVFQPPPGSLVVTTDIEKSTHFSLLHSLPAGAGPADKGVVRSIERQFLAAMVVEIEAVLGVAQGRLRGTLLASGQAFEAEPSYVVVRAGGCQILLDRQYHLHPAMSPILRGIAGVERVARRTGTSILGAGPATQAARSNGRETPAAGQVVAGFEHGPHN